MISTSRMTIRGALLICAVAVAVCCSRRIQATDVTGGDGAAEISKLIDQLGSAFFDEREAASRELRKIGKPALIPLTDAARHKSAEVRSRALVILRQMGTPLVARVPLQDAIQAFAKQPEEKLDLEEGMWLISRILNPTLKRETLTKQLDSLAGAVRKKLGEGVDPKSVEPERIVTLLREVLFEDEKFGGNTIDYQNPANSSLEKVLESKMGLPILVSHVVIAVARRLDVPIVGLPTAGRYIVKYDGRQAPAGFPQRDIYFDPFNGGKVLSREDRLEMFPGTDPDRMVKPGSRRASLIRMLSNLETHLYGRNDNDRAEIAVEFRVALEQNSADANE